MAPLSLSQLLDVAIGTPEVGAVNFTALHSLLQAMLGHLGLQDLPAQERGHSLTPLPGGDRPAKAHPALEKKGDRAEAQAQGTGQQPWEPGERLPGEDSLQGTASSPQVTPIAADVGQMKKKIEANESGISKAMALSQDLLEEIGGMKAVQSRMGEDIRMIQETLGLGNLQDTAGQLPGLHDQPTLDSDVKRLKERLSLYPAPEEVSNMVRWEVLEDCLVGSKGGGGGGGGGGGRGLLVDGSGGRSAPTEPPALDVDTPREASSALGLKGPGTQPAPKTSKGTGKGTPGTQPGSLGTQAAMQRAPVTPEKWSGAPSDRRRTSDASATTPGMQPGSPAIKTTTLGTQPASPSTKTTTPEMQPGTPSTQTTIPGMQPGSPGTQTTIPGMQPHTPSTQTTIPGTQPAPTGTQGGGAGLQPNPPHMEPSLPGTEKVPAEATPSALGTHMDATSPKEGGKALSSTQLARAGHPAVGTLSPRAQAFEIPLDADPRPTSPSQEPAVPWGSLGSSSASDRYVETVEALRQIGQLGHLYATLKEQVAQLEATKLDHAELEKLRLLLLEGDHIALDQESASILADLRGRVSSLQGLASDLQDDKEKIRQLEDALGKLEVAGADWKADGSDQITLQLGSTLQEIKRELKELGEQQEMTKATLEQLVTKTADQLQEQLDELRAMMESAGQEQAEAQAACPICSTDTGTQVGQLLQRYEKLQELVDSFMSQQVVGKVVRQLPARSQQDEELLKRIQATIVQVQGDYEKLSSVTGNLLDDRHQKQKDIESLERLEKEKADKEDLVLGIDVKADKTALAGKVSRAQFDASMERLNEMIQEMLSRVTGQEQGWHQVRRQLSEEMDSKLDRLELGPFRQQLEEHWKSIVEQLKEKAPPTEADDAAGIKKQLLAHFHCVSCDRPLGMLVPGPHIVAIPSMPPLPLRLAGRPHTFLELEQRQQHGHRERAAECGYPSVPRRCGGRHTLAHPLQRCPRLQPLPPGTPRLLQPPTLLPIKHDEMELLGQDGHIYRGRRDGQLPVLVGKEGFPRAKPKLSPRQWDARDTSCLLSRPQSAGSSLSQPGTAASLEHRPASSNGHLSRAPGLIPPLRPPRDGSSTPTARQDWGSPAEPPPRQPPSRRASGSGQQQ
ncbi:glutamine-rich protein 2 [Gavia stellata]|uniref:glutamine-rich protein 2 n=1 Tax=Gavia stellata TaxID=37040 RepID=UPI00289D4303|nr:glutamine-rich protein 2 [Gavia stellata]